MIGDELNGLVGTLLTLGLGVADCVGMPVWMLSGGLLVSALDIVRDGWLTGETGLGVGLVVPAGKGNVGAGVLRSGNVGYGVLSN
jgi:hypothetical protein